MTQVQTLPPQSQLDWAHDAYVALNDPSMPQPGKWPMQNHAFSIPSSLLTAASLERYGQVTPPEELSPGLPHDAREGSISVEELQNETLWPLQEHQQSQSPPPQDTQEPAPKRRRTSRQSAASQGQANSATPPQHDTTPQPPKRKRGRPKSQPQMVEAYTADGFPFQVSSARQSHLEKNRVAAHKCRQRKKEYINGLEGRAREFSSKNKALKENVAMLRDEVLGLKNEVLRHAGCGFWAVDEYLARCAGDLLGMEAPLRTPSTRRSTHSSPMLSTNINTSQFIDQRHHSTDAMTTQPTDASSPDDDDDDFGGLELLRDFDDDDMED